MWGSESRPARLLIADDHAMVRQGTRAMLAREPDVEVVAEARNGREALELCRLHRPDLILMDVRMPEMDGLEATQAVKQQFPQTAVLVVTSHEDPDYLLEAIRAGAAGYVLKEATKGELLQAVRGVISGESPMNQELSARLLRRLAAEPERRTGSPTSPASPPAEAPTEGSEKPPPEALKRALSPREPASSSPSPLTPRETEVLMRLVSGETNRQIARELHISLSTVKRHLEHIIFKLKVSDRTQAAVKAIEMDLLPAFNGQQKGKSP